MTSDGNFLWYFFAGIEEPQTWSGGEATREIAIAAARAEGGDREGFTIVEADTRVPDFDCFDGDDLIERFEEHNDDCWDPDGDPRPIGPTPEQVEDLAAMVATTLRAWMERHDIVPVATAFGTMRNRETFPSAAGDEPTIESPPPRLGEGRGGG